MMAARNRSRHLGLMGMMGLLVMAGVVWLPALARATTRFGSDIEVQAWYRMRNTFQTDGSEHFDWVQWRNEAFIWLTYEEQARSATRMSRVECFWIRHVAEHLAAPPKRG